MKDILFSTSRRTLAARLSRLTDWLPKGILVWTTGGSSVATRQRGPAKRAFSLAITSGTAALVFAGCKGIPTAPERTERERLAAVTRDFRPHDRPAPTPLSAQPTLEELMRFALLNHPEIAAAYFDWAASVESITQERSLPDPRLMFESDITDMIETVMPGLMMDFPGPGKLRLRGDMASAESRAKYFSFESAVLQSAFLLRKAIYNLHFLERRIAIAEQNLAFARDTETVARSQNQVGKVTLQDVVRAHIEVERLETELANLRDSRAPMLAAFKAALGLGPDDPAPPAPPSFSPAPLEVDAGDVQRVAFARNPRLRALRAGIERAEAALQLAHKARVPDFSAGLEADVKASPVMWRPQFSVTLPVWRDKIAAQIAEGQARQQSATAQLSSEEIRLAVDMAEKSFLLREATRNAVLAEQTLIPQARLSLNMAQSRYRSGQVEFLTLIEAWRTLLEFELAAVEAHLQREELLAELNLLIAGVAPPQAPILSAPPSQAEPPLKDAHEN